ncbi:MAG: carbohydrate-binding protein [Bacteroidota bacterium]
MAKAQGAIVIDHKTQRFIGDVSELDRNKFMNAHIWFAGSQNDPEFVDFKNRYNIDPEYKGSRRFWSPLSRLGNDGKIPSSVKKKYDGVRVATNDVATGRASKLMFDKGVDYSVVDISGRSMDVAEYIAKSFRDQWDEVPKFYEPFNEPMVHASDFYPQNFNGIKNDFIITKICEFHRDMGKALHAVPELENVYMTGYASAYPQFENNDFDLWKKRYKKFIDIAGADMDVFSIHLYDGSGLNNSGGRRSGSNAEAIMDLVEAYSFERLNEVKPLAVTEYGRLVTNQPGWPGNGISNYEPVENAQAVRSQIHMVMSFIERGDKMLYTVPFSTGKSNPYTDQYSKAGLWVRKDDGTYELTQRRFFYEVWKDVKGKRIHINSTNIDVQTQAFVEGSQLYVVLNNLNDLTQSIDLEMVDQTGLQHVDIKRLKTFVDDVPELTTTTVDSAPASLSIDYGETIVLTYNFDSDVDFTNTIFSKKYYATSTLHPIVANQDVSFTIDGVETGQGLATLRLGVGRDLGASLSPEVTINGTLVDYTGDVIRGYDQSTRSRFFGTLEIPLGTDLLEEGTNEVQVKFPDDGGHVSSAILQVQLFERPVLEDHISLVNFPDALEASDVYTFDVSYTAARTSDVVVAIYDEENWLASERVTVAAGAGELPITIALPGIPDSSTTCEVRAMLRDEGGNYKTNRARDIQSDLAIIVQTPFAEVAESIPGRIQAEDYDTGGAGISYFDLTEENSGNSYRNDGVDIQPTGDVKGSYNLGWMNAGEWLEYTVDVTNTQNYDFYFRVSSLVGDGQYRVLLDGDLLIEVQEVPNTGDWQEYETIRFPQIGLTAGRHVIRIEVISSGFNLNYWAAWVSPNASTARVTGGINEEMTNETNLPGMYPNPLNLNHEALTITPHDVTTPYSLSITDMLGRVVTSSEEVTGSYKVSRSLFSQPGIYMVRFSWGNTGTFTKLIVK